MEQLKFLIVKGYNKLFNSEKTVEYETIISDENAYKYFSTNDSETRFYINESAREIFAKKLLDEFLNSKGIPEAMEHWKDRALIVLGGTEEKYPHTDNYQIVNNNIGAIISKIYLLAEEEYISLSSETKKIIDFKYERDKTIIYNGEELGVISWVLQEMEDEEYTARQIREYEQSILEYETYGVVLQKGVIKKKEI